MDQLRARSARIAVLRGQARWGRRSVTIVPAQVFENLEVISTATGPTDVERLSYACPLVLAAGRGPGTFVLVAGVRTWHAALAVDQREPGPIRLLALIVAGHNTHVDRLAAELLVLDTGTRITSARGAIARSVYGVFTTGRDAAKRGVLSTVAAGLGISRQAIWARPPRPSRDCRGEADGDRRPPQRRGARARKIRSERRRRNP